MGLKTGNPRGRPVGAKNKRTEALKTAAAAAAKVIETVVADAFNGDSHAYLMSIYKDPAKPDALRIDAAKAAIRYERPALASIEHMGKGGGPIEYSDVRDRLAHLIAREAAASSTDKDT